MKYLPLAAPLALLVLGAACSSSSDGGDEDTPVASTVFEIQSRTTPTGTLVSVEARVMAISANGDRVWISDALAASGISGVEVYRGPNPTPVVAVGDEVEVIGEVQEFGQGSGLTVTQIASSPEFTILTPASGTPVPLTGLDPAVISLDPVPGASQNGEPYEGVLIRLTNLEVSSTTPFTLSDGTTSFGATSEIIALTDAVGTCYATVTGIWNYDVTSDQWVIVPTTAGLVSGGTCS